MTLADQLLAKAQRPLRGQHPVQSHALGSLLQDFPFLRRLVLFPGVTLDIDGRRSQPSFATRSPEQREQAHLPSRHTRMARCKHPLFHGPASMVVFRDRTSGLTTLLPTIPSLPSSAIGWRWGSSCVVLLVNHEPHSRLPCQNSQMLNRPCVTANFSRWCCSGDSYAQSNTRIRNIPPTKAGGHIPLESFSEIVNCLASSEWLSRITIPDETDDATSTESSTLLDRSEDKVSHARLRSQPPMAKRSN